MSSSSKSTNVGRSDGARTRSIFAATSKQPALPSEGNVSPSARGENVSARAVKVQDPSAAISPLSGSDVSRSCEVRPQDQSDSHEEFSNQTGGVAAISAPTDASVRDAGRSSTAVFKASPRPAASHGATLQPPGQASAVTFPAFQPWAESHVRPSLSGPAPHPPQQMSHHPSNEQFPASHGPSQAQVHNVPFIRAPALLAMQTFPPLGLPI